MDQNQPTTYFFAGTDTDVGKTYVASLFAKAVRAAGRNVGVYKPVASGCRQDGDQRIADDALSLWEAAGRPRTLEDVCPQKFLAPLAPTAAARMESTTVDKTKLYSGANRWQESEVLIVEGAGGLLSPLAESVLNIDLYKQLVRASLVIVAANRLGVIHQTLASCAAAAHHGVEVMGIVLCCVDAQPDESIKTNHTELEKYTSIPILARVGFQQPQLTLDDQWCLPKSE